MKFLRLIGWTLLAASVVTTLLTAITLCIVFWGWLLGNFVDWTVHPLSLDWGRLRFIFAGCSIPGIIFGSAIAAGIIDD